VGYPLSVGPVCWIVGRNPNLVEGNLSFISEVPRAYWPIGWVADRVEFVKHAINRYAKMGMHPDSDIAFPTNYVRGGAFFIPY
jgi:hypothetical protein